MAEEYLRHANLTVNNRDEMYANARKYYWKVYNESKQPWQVDRALCSMFECYATGEEKQAFYDKHVNHKFSSDQWKKEFDTLVESFGEPGKSK